MNIAEQLKELVLSAVPTIVLLYLFYFFLKANFFQPLEKVMAERSRRSEGARKEAEAAQAAAAEKVRNYHDALKKARAEVYAEQDTVRRAVLDERAALIREARAKAHEEVRAGKDAIAADLDRAKAEIQGASQGLAGDIVRAILEPRAGGGR